MFNQDRDTPRNTSNEIRVVLADDHQLFRQGLKALLELERGITIVGEASDGLEVQRVAVEQNANVVLMDINMPIVDGLSATRELLRANPEIGVIILSMHHEEGHVFQALRAGARGYLLKTSKVSEVAGAVRAVASGLSLLDPSVTSSVVSEFKRMSSKQTPEDGLGQLTETEVKILQHVSAGMSNKEIANKLSLAESTVKNRLSVLFEKIGVLDRMQAATRVPRAPSFVEGVINLRGKVIPVVDLRRRFGLASAEHTRASRIVVVEIGDEVVGIIVDGVSEVLRVDTATVEPP